MGVDDSGGSFLAPMPSVDLKVSQALLLHPLPNMTGADVDGGPCILAYEKK